MTDITVYDATLRDGAQCEGINFSLEDKLAIALKLDELGVHYIEGGYPFSNEKDMTIGITIALGILRRSNAFIPLSNGTYATAIAAMETRESLPPIIAANSRPSLRIDRNPKAR